MRDERGSIIPLILGFALIALIVVAGSITLGEAFVQQRDLQDICDGAAVAAAASAADLDRSAAVASRHSLQFADVDQQIDVYLARDPERHTVHVDATLSDDRQRITLSCTQVSTLTLGSFFGRSTVHHSVTSSARAAVLG